MVIAKQTWLVRDKGSTPYKETDVATCLLARDYKGLGNQDGNAVLEVKKDGDEN